MAGGRTAMIVRGAMLLAAALSATGARAQPVHDIVFTGARAIDPETGLDAIRNVAVDGDRIVAVTAARLDGRRMIDARGLVAAPGFIDLHSHATTREAATYQVRDGVTTRLELEIGTWPVADWYQAKRGRELLNYGTSVGHTAVRYYLQKGEGEAGLAALRDPAEKFAAPEADRPIADTAYPRLASLLEQGLEEGAIGIGSGTQYAPGITHRELLDVTRVAARSKSCLFTHIRFGSLVEPDSTLEAVQENIANAAITGACVHIAHINSMAMSEAPAMVALMRDARGRGVDISTETYPWGGSVDAVRSHFFDPGWEKRWGVGVGDLQSRRTGKRLTQADFDVLRAGSGDDGIIMHMNSEATIAALLADPTVIVASDGGRIEGPNGHPRSAGTFARVLGHYVRETKALGLSEAIRKMTLAPAQRLQSFVPAMARKGRLQPGADADIVLFDPATVGTKATYGDAARPSEGFRYVMVNGVFVVDGGELVEGVSPGRPIQSEIAR
ncbi:amidohydrolase family protein [Sphingopyxis macrogoltabida]|uniref:D-glutamate deacylase n=1 Tax=Sphingopyxis macrogoltabida TaxID=33050 RepID=A0A0N9V8X8_SPHMC|nr:amidohydrolase family protein [Sphingopyxis macrogoltabida]ALH80767.1 D-glutamate deacylase [Sphingopyxis macrogoltabida]